MSEKQHSLPKLGWSHFFQQQLSLEEWESLAPVRVLAVHRTSVDVTGEHGRRNIGLPSHWHQHDAEDLPTVGDWLLVDVFGYQPQRLLERKSLIRRRAAGNASKVQLIAANVDTLFIVTSCNRDFNPSRLERYLALALESRVEPVVVLTKADLADDVSDFQRRAMELRPDLAVEALNALDACSVEPLSLWCGSGQTVALVGSSGVGKSTLINTLCGAAGQETAAIREADARGRHTTTSRSLHFLPQGGVLIDTPGLRELQLSACRDGVALLFGDIEELAQGCRFNDCRHQSEAGCAVKAAVAAGDLDPRRLTNYLKLMAEQERNAETIAERRRRERSFGKLCKSVLAVRRKERDE